ncbi:MAG: hypothetical protein QGF56_11740 [Verrucomicrobiota bacterium]|jgi:hypothetical protein|nr:hypothetical protein [Verrucomicrobiota bacterium]
MSEAKNTDPLKELDLELEFLPAWAQKPNDAKPYADYAGEEKSRGRGRGDWGDRPPRRRDDNRGRDFKGRDQKGRGDRDRNRDGDRRDDRRPKFQKRDGKRPFDKKKNFRRNDPPPRPPLELDVAIQPEKQGVESLARQIKHTGRAYPLFDIARLILAKPERYLVLLKTRKKEDGSVAQPLFFCQVDETVWLSEDQAVDHVLARHFDTFYKTEKTEIDPPKGTYTFVAQCGMSDEILGPPNYHGYQDKLRALHAARFARLPFDVFKSRVKIVHDEEIVKQWLDEQSWKTEYIAINLPEEAKLESRASVRDHFRQHHLANVVAGVDDVALKASVFSKKTPPRMQNLVRYELDDQRRFPLKVVNLLSQEFSSHGLQFFKRKKSVTHVSVSRPHHLDLGNTPVSDSIRAIVSFVVENRDCTRRMILDQFAPEPEKPESAEAPAEGAEPAPDASLSPERTAVLSDLHWLVHQGHVIEYANGQMEIAPKPQPPQQKKKKPKPEKKTKPEPAAERTETGGTTSTSTEAKAETPADAPAAEEAKPAETPEPSAVEPEPSPEPPASEVSDTTEASEPDQALGQEPEPTEPSAEPPAPEVSDTTETSSEPSQALGQADAPTESVEPTEADSAEEEPPAAAEESPAPDDSPAEEPPAKAAE